MEITDLLIFTQKNNASDLHLSVGNAPILRVNGDMLPMKTNALTPEDIAANPDSFTGKYLQRYL